MKTQQEILSEILKDQAVTAAVLGLSESFKNIDSVRLSFPHYFRVCAALGDVINALELSTVNAPPGADGLNRFIPFVALGMPAFGSQLIEHLGDAYLESQGIDKLFYDEVAAEARDKGEAGEPNYMHGLLVLDLVGGLLVEMCGVSLMVAVAQDIDESLPQSAGEFH